MKSDPPRSPPGRRIRSSRKKRRWRNPAVVQPARTGWCDSHFPGMMRAPRGRWRRCASFTYSPCFPYPPGTLLSARLAGDQDASRMMIRLHESHHGSDSVHLDRTVCPVKPSPSRTGWGRIAAPGTRTGPGSPAGPACTDAGTAGSGSPTASSSQESARPGWRVRGQEQRPHD
jgi:hypothetical protein